MPEKSKGELTDAALMVLKKYLDCGMSKIKTARELGRSYIYISKYLAQPYVKNLLRMAMLEKNITFDKIATRIAEGVDATKVVGYLNNKVDGVQKVSDEFVTIPDFFAREKYIKLALNIFGVIDAPIIEDSGPHLHFYNIKQIIEDANRNPDSRENNIQDASPRGSEELGKRTT